ncbi:hypothetical protein [Lentzea sp. E54]|uniref:hypothetical protein n=1 Tax=Lentzea xerophila TaxID=3435883 RepID=UPI003DA55986
MIPDLQGTRWCRCTGSDGKPAVLTLSWREDVVSCQTSAGDWFALTAKEARELAEALLYGVGRRSGSPAAR